MRQSDVEVDDADMGLAGRTHSAGWFGVQDGGR